MEIKVIFLQISV